MTQTLDWSTYASALRSNGVHWDLFTVLDVDWGNSLVRRSFSSDEGHYPSGGVKALMESDWARQVVFGQQPFVSDSRASFRAAFGDYELLESLGLHYALNVPVVVGGRTTRTLNLLRKEGAYSIDDEVLVKTTFGRAVNPALGATA